MNLIEGMKLLVHLRLLLYSALDAGFGLGLSWQRLVRFLVSFRVNYFRTQVARLHSVEA